MRRKVIRQTIIFTNLSLSMLSLLQVSKLTLLYVKITFYKRLKMTDTENYNTAIVNKNYNGWRIDKFLVMSFPDISRSQIQRLLKEGNVSRDEETVADNSYKVKEGEIYQLIIPEAAEADPQPENIPLTILYEDEDLIVVNKPAGMTVHPAPGSPSGTLVNALLYHCQGRLSGIGGVKRPGIVHRIDKDTSGVLVVAKNDTSHKDLCRQFAEHSIERTYFAAVFGVPNPLAGKIEGDIGRSPYDRKKMAIVHKNGKAAVTHYKTTKIFNGAASLVQCNLETGRTHQIRVHLSSQGWNLIGDQLYVKSKKLNAKNLNEEAKFFVNNFPRQALHAKSLGFVHPRTKEQMSFCSDFPEDFQALISSLENL